MHTRSKSSRFQIFSLALSAIIVAALSLACGGDDSAQPTAPTVDAAQGDAAPSAAERVKPVSADARQCIDLVKAQHYVEAIDPCERAVRDSANATNVEVQQAYNEATAKAKDASREAALKAEADMREGKSAEETAQGALDDALGK
jgi:hypothetical protein